MTGETKLSLIKALWHYNRVANGTANIRSWKHSGFSVDQSARLDAGDREGVERLRQYFLRCPFSQARMIEVTDEGKVLYQTGDNRLGRFPEAASDDLLAGDPLMVAPSIDPRKVLLVLATFDKAAPSKKGFELRRAMGRPETIIVPTGHLTALLYVPYIKPACLRFFREKFAD